MAAPKKAPKAEANETAKPEAPKAVVGNIGAVSTGKREPVTEKLAGGTVKVTY